jgi:hypothetical protein
MVASEEAHLAVRYGSWTPVQTIVMLADTYPSDHFRVMGILKSMSVKVTDGALSYEYLAERASFRMADIDTIMTTDAAISSELDGMSVFTVSMTKYGEEASPHPLTTDNGLADDQVPVGKYIEIEVIENDQSMSEDSFEYAIVRLYYTMNDLDRTADGDADDPVDIDETTLHLYMYEEDSEEWTMLTDGLDWVNEVGLHTDDEEVYGIQFAGFLWVNLTHLSLFSAGGEIISEIVTTADPGTDRTALVGEPVTLDGSASEGIGGIKVYTWTFKHEWQTVTLPGETTSFTFQAPGEYEVSLQVMDFYGGIDTATFIITVEPMNIMVRFGPVVDEDGMPLYGPCDVGRDGPQGDDGLFRLCRSEDHQGRHWR